MGCSTAASETASASCYVASLIFSFKSLAAWIAAVSCSTAAREAASANCNVTSCASTSSRHASQIATMNAIEYLGSIYSTQHHVDILPASATGGGSRGNPSNGQLLLHHTCLELSTSCETAAYTDGGGGGAMSTHGRRAYCFAPSGSVCSLAFSCSPFFSFFWRVGTC
jgi:hypothetical protein